MAYEENAEEHHEQHLIPYPVYFLIWIVLLFCTALTVGVAQIDVGSAAISTIVAMGIATFKCTLVLLYFMHLKYEHPLFRWMFIITISTYAVFVILTFADTIFRY